MNINILHHFFVADIHGCYDEFCKMMEKIHCKISELAIPKQNIKIILLGDLINKGPQSEKVLTFARKNKLLSLLGNHELLYLKGIGQNTQRSKEYRKIIGEANHHYIEGFLPYIDHPQFIALHGGIDLRSINKKLPLPDYDKAVSTALRQSSYAELTTLRELDTGEPWHSIYRGKRPIIYGHWAKQGLHFSKNTFGIDNGCVYGKSLCAFHLEANSIIEVKAKEIYQPISSG